MTSTLTICLMYINTVYSSSDSWPSSSTDLAAFGAVSARAMSSPLGAGQVSLAGAGQAPLVASPIVAGAAPPAAVAGRPSLHERTVRRYVSSIAAGKISVDELQYMFNDGPNDERAAAIRFSIQHGPKAAARLYPETVIYPAKAKASASAANAAEAPPSGAPANAGIDTAAPSGVPAKAAGVAASPAAIVPAKRLASDLDRAGGGVGSSDHEDVLAAAFGPYLAQRVRFLDDALAKASDELVSTSRAYAVAKARHDLLRQERRSLEPSISAARYRYQLALPRSAGARAPPSDSD